MDKTVEDLNKKIENLDKTIKDKNERLIDMYKQMSLQSRRIADLVQWDRLNDEIAELRSERDFYKTKYENKEKKNDELFQLLYDKADGKNWPLTAEELYCITKRIQVNLILGLYFDNDYYKHHGVPCKYCKYSYESLFGDDAHRNTKFLYLDSRDEVVEVMPNETICKATQHNMSDHYDIFSLLTKLTGLEMPRSADENVMDRRESE